MKRIVLAVLVLFNGFYVDAATRAYKTGYATTDTITDLISFRTTCSASRYDTMASEDDVSYQVPTGKVLYITKINYASGAAAGAFQVGYADDAVDNSAGAPTNPDALTSNIAAAAASTLYSLDIFISSVPAGKYPYIQEVSGGGTLWTTVSGILVDQ